jgi:hypothetical protein
MAPSKKIAGTENIRPNLYKVMHKYLRVEMSDVIGLAGATDFCNEAQRQEFEIRFKDFTKLLDDHASREEKYIHPLLEECKSKELKRVEEEHISLEEQIASLKTNFEKIEAQQSAYQFYLDLTQFQANYLRHLLSEERRLLPELQKHCSDEQLNAASRNMLADMPKDAMVNITKGMLPTMNHPERVEMFSAMKAGMPETVFAYFLNLASQALRPEQMQKLCLAVDISFAELTNKTGICSSRP